MLLLRILGMLWRVGEQAWKYLFCTLVQDRLFAEQVAVIKAPRLEGWTPLHEAINTQRWAWPCVRAALSLSMNSDFILRWMGERLSVSRRSICVAMWVCPGCSLVLGLIIVWSSRLQGTVVAQHQVWSGSDECCRPSGLGGA